MMTKELLEQVATMELRDQLEAKEQMIKGLNGLIDSQQQTNEALAKRIEKLRVAISSALNYLACLDDLTEINGKCNDQMAFDVLRMALEK
jgi:uncharacterized membrane protein YgaE (UPF0421/DUF939 family)